MEQKKSFILYNDYNDLFQSLKDNEAGKLIKHIFNLVNGRESELKSRVLKTAFIGIEKQLKRDGNKWEHIRKERSKSGKRSAEVRRLKRISTNSTNVDFVQQTSTTSTVNDNVNKNVNDIPILKDFMLYIKSQVSKEEYLAKKENLKNKFISWSENDWKDGYGNPITNWKSKIMGNLQYIKKDSFNQL